jgi:hypothetical protein
MLSPCLSRALLFLLALATAVNAAAQSGPARYPWDDRPDVCFQSEGATSPRCQAENWPTWDKTIERIRQLYKSEQFALLDRAMGEIASSKESFGNGDSPASAAYWAFRGLMAAPGTQQYHEARIARWRASVPKSDYATFAQARYLYGTAWNARGSGTASSVSRESWELFAIRLQEAETVLRSASDDFQRTPYWHHLLLAIVLDSPREQRNVESVFLEAVSRWPRYFDFYEARLTRLVPKWGGSWEEVESFIDKWSRQLSNTEGESVYARLYISVKDQGVTPEQTQMNWKRMKAGFKDLTARYPDVAFKNLYASYACYARDIPAFREAVSVLRPGEINDGNWLSGHSYDACMRWAAT